MAEPVDCPALRERRHDKGYPYGERVPAKVHVFGYVTPDWPGALSIKALGVDIEVAQPGQVYDAWTNSYGAVSAVLPGGQHLGLVPGEFEVVEWHDLKEPSHDR